MWGGLKDGNLEELKGTIGSIVDLSCRGVRWRVDDAPNKLGLAS